MHSFEPQQTFELIEREVKSRLEPQGYTITKQDYHPHVHGTRYTVFGCPSGHVRLTWDGKAETLILRAYRKGNPLVRTFFMTFFGRYDLDKLTHEVTAKAEELRSLSEEQLVRKFTERL
ncbi:hypothetical protein GE107_00195 [Cohnella sp. CFH 77786]|uniref:hypothetical protein n=1 Tax=Cohnella sp. CFH 77786 TaxID=2662265 RepID=UPI001C60EA44|nr:hypothetical protein [Cohnella sp. CFH 77786]MBW5444483.1 hypothetical protein [Cohnella sp. CFH 77786]